MDIEEGNKMELSDKKIRAHKVLSLIAFIIGCPMCTILGLATLGSFVSNESGRLFSILFCFVYFLVFLYITIFSVINIHFLREVRVYFDILSTQHPDSIDHLARIVGITSDAVRRNLNKIIYSRYITGMYIDHSCGMIFYLDEPHGQDVAAAVNGEVPD